MLALLRKMGILSKQYVVNDSVNSFKVFLVLKIVKKNVFIRSYSVSSLSRRNSRSLSEMDKASTRAEKSHDRIVKSAHEVQDPRLPL